MATSASDFGGGCIFRVTPNTDGDAWYWAGHGQLRRVPNGQGMGSFLQGIGWPRIDISASSLAEMVQNFGQGPDFS